MLEGHRGRLAPARREGLQLVLARWREVVSSSREAAGAAEVSGDPGVTGDPEDDRRFRKPNTGPRR